MFSNADILAATSEVCRAFGGPYNSFERSGTPENEIFFVPIPDPEKRVVVSLWLQDLSIAMLLLEREGQAIRPLQSWQSKQSDLDFGFKGVLEEWGQSHPIESLYANAVPDSNSEAHPIKRLLPGLQVEIVAPISSIEGFAIYHERKADVDHSQYLGWARLQEIMRRMAAPDPSPLAMALFQALGQKPTILVSHLYAEELAK